MTKVSDLGDDANLTNVPIRLPEEALQKFKDYAGGEPVMYCCGGVMGYGFMMSPHPPGMEERRLYPLPIDISPSEILDWEVVDK